MKINLNKKYMFWGIVALVLIAVIAIFAVVNWGGGFVEQRLTKYCLNISYDESLHKLKGKETVTYVNNSDNAFSTLYFHLYPNAFREGAKNGVVSPNNFGEAYPNGYSYGKIEIFEVVYPNGENATFKIGGEDENILEIPLQTELYPDESVVLIIEFETVLANINHRLGYGDNTINFGNFYPVACVYENGAGFSQSLYHSNGDPFYSECAEYEVMVEYPAFFEIASTGNQTEMKIDKDRIQAFYYADKVRDFCFVLSQAFEKTKGEYNGIEINYYGYIGDENLEECLKTSIDAMSTFEEMFGDYPYSQISIVKSNFVHGGMEYPNIVLISDAIKKQSDINYVIIHELAHQWWYGVVGNDQYNHAWLDEGLAEYSTLLFFKQHEEYNESFESLVDGAIESYKLFEKIYTKVNGSVDGSMERALCDFSTEPEYVQCTYTKGVIMFNTLREMVGSKKFLSTLKDYFFQFKYKLASPEDLIALFVENCGKNMEGFFESWLYGKVVIK